MRWTLFTDGRKKFDRLIQDIDAAINHIHMQYYIYRSDNLGVEVRDALIKLLNEG